MLFSFIFLKWNAHVQRELHRISDAQQIHVLWPIGQNRQDAALSMFVAARHSRVQWLSDTA